MPFFIPTEKYRNYLANICHSLFLQKTIEMLCTQHMPKKKEKKESYSWFSWRRKTTDGTTATSAGPPVLSESDVAASKSVSNVKVWKIRTQEKNAVIILKL